MATRSARPPSAECHRLLPATAKRRSTCCSKGPPGDHRPRPRASPGDARLFSIRTGPFAGGPAVQNKGGAHGEVSAPAGGTNVARGHLGPRRGAGARGPPEVGAEAVLVRVALPARVALLARLVGGTARRDIPGAVGRQWGRGRRCKVGGRRRSLP